MSDILDSLIDSHLPAAARGDRDAYGRIVAGCQSTVTSIALAIVRDVPASEDIAQEAFLSAWQNLRKLNNRASFLPWLRQITRNLARDHLRAQGLRANPTTDIEALIATVADPHPGPAEQLATEQERAVAAGVIDALPEESREVLLLYYREGQSSRQVAGLLGLQDAAVRKRLSRAREKVREELLARLGDFARRTAPGAGFTAAVAAMLVVGAPPAAAATALGAGALGGGHGLAKLGLGSLGGVFIGVAAGLWGVWFGVRRLLRAPFDSRERRGVLAYALSTSALTVAFAVGIVWASRTPGWIAPVAVTFAFVVGIVFTSGWWFPRIVARRMAHERQVDPDAGRRQRRGQRWSRVGAATGIVLGLGGMLLGLWLDGRIG